MSEKTMRSAVAAAFEGRPTRTAATSDRPVTAPGSRGSSDVLTSDGDCDRIRIRGLVKRYGDVTVFDGFDLCIQKGVPTLLMGVSGGGKTTLARILMGLETLDAGTVEGMEGMRLAAVFQEDRLCRNLTVGTNVCMPHAGLTHAQRSELDARVDDLLGRMGMPGCMDRPVRELSGGMCRRVAILRAVLAPSQMVVFDEPLKGLDGATKRAVMDVVVPLVAGKTVLWVTHDEGDAAFFEAPRIVRL